MRDCVFVFEGWGAEGKKQLKLHLCGALVASCTSMSSYEYAQVRTQYLLSTQRSDSCCIRTYNPKPHARRCALSSSE